jgi:hypothetical protein
MQNRRNNILNTGSFDQDDMNDILNLYIGKFAPGSNNIKICVSSTAVDGDKVLMKADEMLEYLVKHEGPVQEGRTYLLGVNAGSHWEGVFVRLNGSKLTVKYVEPNLVDMIRQQLVSENNLLQQIKKNLSEDKLRDIFGKKNIEIEYEAHIDGAWTQDGGEECGPFVCADLIRLAIPKELKKYNSVLANDENPGGAAIRQEQVDLIGGIELKLTVPQQERKILIPLNIDEIRLRSDLSRLLTTVNTADEYKEKLRDNITITAQTALSLVDVDLITNASSARFEKLQKTLNKMSMIEYIIDSIFYVFGWDKKSQFVNKEMEMIKKDMIRSPNGKETTDLQR